MTDCSTFDPFLSRSLSPCLSIGRFLTVHVRLSSRSLARLWWWSWSWWDVCLFPLITPTGQLLPFLCSWATRTNIDRSISLRTISRRWTVIITANVSMWRHIEHDILFSFDEGELSLDRIKFERKKKYEPSSPDELSTSLSSRDNRRAQMRFLLLLADLLLLLLVLERLFLTACFFFRLDN